MNMRSPVGTSLSSLVRHARTSWTIDLAGRPNSSVRSPEVVPRRQRCRCDTTPGDHGAGPQRRVDLRMTKAQLRCGHRLSWAFALERMTGIEPAFSPWEPG